MRKRRTFRPTVIWLRTRLIPGVVAIAVALLAVLIFRPVAQTAWLEITAPSEAIAGQPFVAQVTLRAQSAGHFLHLDLHGLDVHRDPLGSLGPGRPQEIDPATASYVFTLSIPGRTDLDAVFGIVYVSSTGSWQDREAVAKTEQIRVRPAGTSPLSVAVGRLPVHELDHGPAVQIPDAPVTQGLIAACWFASAVLAWRLRPRETVTGRHAFPILASICLVFGIWEATAPGLELADLARSIARDLHLYNERRWTQQILTVTCVGLFGVVAAIAVQRSRRRAPFAAIAGICGYAGVTLAGMLSLHEVDILLATPVLSVPVASVLRLLAALAVLGGLVWRSATGRRTTRLP